MSISSEVTGAWLEFHDPGNRIFHKLGDLELESGDVLPDVTIAYQTWGTLNQEKSNAILIAKSRNFYFFTILKSAFKFIENQFN